MTSLRVDQTVARSGCRVPHRRRATGPGHRRWTAQLVTETGTNSSGGSHAAGFTNGNARASVLHDVREPVS